MKDHKLKIIWRSMHHRCYNQTQDSYPLYGGRGITVDQRWHGKSGFDAFVSDMGDRPPGASIDRIDPDKGYSPENCRWADKYQQANNKRTNRWFTASGKTQTLAQWAKELGCKPAAILARLKTGMSEEEAVTKPIPERPNAKLKDEDALYATNNYPMMTAQAIADTLGVSKKTVLNILHGRTFSDVTGITKD